MFVRDEEDTTRDAGVRWKYLARKIHRPHLENMVAWAAANVAKGAAKPRFVELPELDRQLAEAAAEEERQIQRKFGRIYQEKRESKDAIARWRAQRRAEIAALHARAWSQKEWRDAVAARVRDNYYHARTRIDRAEYFTLFDAPPREPEAEPLDPTAFEEERLERMKTAQEMFEDVLDAEYAACGKEEAARRDAEVYLTLELGAEARDLSLVTPATARGLKEGFEEVAFKRRMEEYRLVPKKVLLSS
jgi:hypothetical protein